MASVYMHYNGDNESRYPTRQRLGLAFSVSLCWSLTVRAYSMAHVIASAETATSKVSC
jgi:hypothetical protein